jgi:hypothetical protein
LQLFIIIKEVLDRMRCSIKPIFSDSNAQM